MMKLNRMFRLLYVLFVVLHIYASVALAQAEGEILVIDVEGPVTPIMLSFIERAIVEADIRNAEALIIRLDTPGGSVDITKEIVQAIIASEVPIVVYVWPPGGIAASAGTFITLAGDVAAMAPNTSIGAASPINSDGSDINETVQSKVENILVADITGLAQRRGEAAAAWAEQTITEAKAANSEEALALGVIDFVASDLDDLIRQLDGFVVAGAGQDVTLATINKPVNYLETTTAEELLRIITHPSVAFWLISTGVIALFYEIVNPGSYISGMIGLILILVGAYGIGQLPVNYAGVALIVLGLILFIAEVFTPTFGALTLGGIVAFIVGGLILFDTAEFSYRMPWPSIIGIPVTMALLIGFGLRKIVQAAKQQVVTGAEGLIGAIGRVKVDLHPHGTVLVWGERWQATSVDEQDIAAGEEVEVVARDGFRLRVAKIEKKW